MLQYIKNRNIPQSDFNYFPDMLFPLCKLKSCNVILSRRQADFNVCLTSLRLVSINKNVLTSILRKDASYNTFFFECCHICRLITCCSSRTFPLRSCLLIIHGHIPISFFFIFSVVETESLITQPV